jgi:hypothetical protein
VTLAADHPLRVAAGFVNAGNPSGQVACFPVDPEVHAMVPSAAAAGAVSAPRSGGSISYQEEGQHPPAPPRRFVHGTDRQNLVFSRRHVTART